jgi:hypothetical protein
MDTELRQTVELGKHCMIVEPHHDDAWLGCANIIMGHPDTEFTIYSLFESNYNKKKDVGNICEEVPNITQMIFKDYQDIVWISPEKDRIKSLLRISENNIGADDAMKMFCYYNPCGAECVFETFIHDCVQIRPDSILFPMGVFHPAHQVTRQIFASVLKSPTTYLYREYPYFWRKSEKGHDKDLELVCEMQAVSGTKKFDVLKKVYPKQFFWLYHRGPNKHFNEEALYRKK